MTEDDVIRSQASHIRRVGELLCLVTFDLSLRAVRHDESKWSPEEWPHFKEATPKLSKSVYGSEEYRQNVKALGPALSHHQKVNRHHPEYHPNGVADMTLVDLIEMLADWKAASERHETGDILKSIEVNKSRFQISPELCRILENTVRAYFLTGKDAQK